jgi:DNA-binding XRE family transcriptional regulator
MGNQSPNDWWIMAIFLCDDGARHDVRSAQLQKTRAKGPTKRTECGKKTFNQDLRMKKHKSIALEDILKKELKDQEIKIHFEHKRFYLQIAHLMTELREKSGLSQSEVAKRAHVSQPLIARLEKGDQNRVPTFDTIYRVLKVLGYNLELRAVPNKKLVA